MAVPPPREDAAKALVKLKLAEEGIAVVREGSLGAAEIDAKQLIDQHYYAIASKATILKPHQLNVPAEKFAQKVRGFAGSPGDPAG